VLIEAPVEKSSDQNQQRAGHLRRAAALLGVDDLQDIELGNLADGPLAPDGDEVGAEVALGNRAAALVRQLVGDERLGGIAE